MRRFSLVLGVGVAVCCVPAEAAPLSGGFSYQGQLKENGTPVNGVVHLGFSLWDAAGSGSPPVGGVQIGSPQIITNVPVSNGLFTVMLNDNGEFGTNPFNGDARFLEVAVCDDPACTGATVLSPRQAIAAAPYALKAKGASSNWRDNGDDVFLPAGKVGIGTNAPTASIHIQRPFADTGIRFQSARFNQGPPLSTQSAPTAAVASGSGVAWTNPGAAITSDGARAEVSLSGSLGSNDADQSQPLRLTNLGFSLPADALIVGILVTLEGRSSCSCFDCDVCKVPVVVELLGGSSATAQRSVTFTDTQAQQFAGGTFDVWEHAFTAAEINAPSFGVQLAASLELLETQFCIPGLGCVHTECDCLGIGTPGIDATAVTVFFYDPSVTTTLLDWSLGLSQDDTNFRIAPTADLSSPIVVVTPQGSVGIGTTEFLQGFFKLAISGAAAKPNGGQWSALSDARVKRNVEGLSGVLNRLLSLRGVSFEFTEEGLRTGLATPGRHVGLIAQEVEPVFPEWVEQSPSGYKFVNEQGTTALFVEALRELRAEKDAQLADRDAELRRMRREKDAEIAALAARLERLEQSQPTRP
ncbi:MAG: tail fiber domain-containing protein [Planctomycetes bacterium]|nr:tail fiber domain-containing protein [Planctomycetota bacterium]